MNKGGATVERNLQVAAWHEKLDFVYMPSFVLGYPGETKEDLKLTLEFLKRIRNDKVAFLLVNWFSPLPGSASYEIVREKYGFDENDLSIWHLRSNATRGSGEVYTDIEPSVFKEAFLEAQNIAGHNDYKGIVRRTTKKVLRELLKKGRTLKIALFGFGTLFKDFIEKYEALNEEDRDKLQIKIIFDNDPKKIGQSFAGIPIKKIEADSFADIDMIVITSHFYEEIIDQIRLLDRDYDKVIAAKLFD